MHGHWGFLLGVQTQTTSAHWTATPGTSSEALHWGQLTLMMTVSSVSTHIRLKPNKARVCASKCYRLPSKSWLALGRKEERIFSTLTCNGPLEPCWVAPLCKTGSASWAASRAWPRQFSPQLSVQAFGYIYLEYNAKLDPCFWKLQLCKETYVAWSMNRGSKQPAWEALATNM